MRRIPATIQELTPAFVHRIVLLDRLASEWRPDARFLVLAQSEESRDQVERWRRAGLLNISWVFGDDLLDGDIVVPNQTRSEAIVLYRESDRHHSLLLTNQCNSYCLMCSQPPTKYEDSWLTEQAIEIISHIRLSPRVIGLSGGEPLLIREDLRRVFDALYAHHPDTAVEVLTNGRLLGDGSIAETVLGSLPTKVKWLVPLYGHADFFHDFVVQSPGAFEETINGLLTLQSHHQSIQLRIVLIKPVLEVLEDLCCFIGKNLPFIHHVALMACEPIGFALANRELCEVDLMDWEGTLANASRILNRFSIPHIFMNAPLCALPPSLWPMAHKSISDWKNTYTDDCGHCSVKDSCAGLFAWHERGWKPTKIRPIMGVNQ